MEARVKTGDLQLFRTKNKAYENFIGELRGVFTEPGEKYGKIQVTKRDKEGITKVIIKDGDTEVGFIYRNVDLYIIGFVVKSPINDKSSIFYVDKEVYDTKKGKISPNWTSVIGTNNVEPLSDSFSYPFIMPQKENTVLLIGKLGASLAQLTKVGDTDKRPDIIKYHLAPFVVAFCEAIRFPVVAQKVQDVIRKPGGVLKLSMNLVGPLSLGSKRTTDYGLNIYNLMLNWSALSERAFLLYLNPSQNVPPLKEGQYTLGLEKNQINTLLGVAVSSQFEKISTASVRPKRDLESMVDHADLRHPALLDQQSQINHIGYEGNVEQPYPRESTSGIASITQSPDLVGALHLLSVGLLYLYGKKMNVPIAANQQDLDPREAYGVAANLMDRIECFLGSSGLELELGFEEKIRLQREVAMALVHGKQVEPIWTKVLDSKFPVKQNNHGVEKVREQLSKALAAESGLLEKNNFEGDECFQ